MELVEDQGADAFQKRILQKAAQQDARCDNQNACLRTHFGIHAHGVTDLFTQAATVFLGHAPCGRAHGQTPRLNQNHLTRKLIDQRRRHSCGFARARGGFQDQRGVRGQGLPNAIDPSIDRKGV